MRCDVPLKKLLIRTWRGPLPYWTHQFCQSVRLLEEQGWKFIIPEWCEVERRCKDKLGITIPSEIDTRKPGDYDPALGALFDDIITANQADFWGHFNLDCVYGRLSHWLPDSFLDNIDVYGNDPGAVCGPFTLYRNCEKVNNLFRGVPHWKRDLESGRFLGWDEGHFSQHIRDSALCGDIRFASGFLQAHDHMTAKHRKLATTGNNPLMPVSFTPYPKHALIDNVTGQEIMMYHFNQTRRWPVG